MVVVMLVVTMLVVVVVMVIVKEVVMTTAHHPHHNSTSPSPQQHITPHHPDGKTHTITKPPTPHHNTTHTTTQHHPHHKPTSPTPQHIIMHITTRHHPHHNTMEISSTPLDRDTPSRFTLYEFRVGFFTTCPLYSPRFSPRVFVLGITNTVKLTACRATGGLNIFVCFGVFMSVMLVLVQGGGGLRRP